MSKKKITILLADDDEDDRYFFNTALTQLNLEADLLNFINGEEIINYFRAAKDVPDFIFLDINMPKADGIECLKFIRKIYPGDQATIVMLSTASESYIIDLTRQHGASAYIEKPNQLKELVKCLAYCLLELKSNSSAQPFLLNAHLKNS